MLMDEKGEGWELIKFSLSLSLYAFALLYFNYFNNNVVNVNIDKNLIMEMGDWNWNRKKSFAAILNTLFAV